MTDSTPDSATIQIPLTKGYVAIVDEIDIDLSFLKWYADAKKDGTTQYAIRNIQIGPNRKTQQLHRVILSRILDRDILSIEFCDHINGNGLDNRRCNLRLANRSQNSMNSRKPITNTSGYKGVRKIDNGWIATIVSNKQHIYLGYFKTPKDAARAYNEAALIYHGEFARLNVIEE